MTFWILIWSGYIGVDGLHFKTKAACEKYAFERIAKWPDLESLPKGPRCIEIIK